ncbi:hypothetical protein DI43_03720 [Geobacillus sp. CAMR12739]|nr:hypothetical protein DI43_03720 [Geobacillus sp. CAMR12739]
MPIVTAASAVVLGIIMTFVWPPIQHGLNAFSHNMIDANKTLAAFIFGVIERALIPFGLHHIFYAPFWFEFGEYVNKAGQVVHGDQKIFFEQLKDGVKLTAGTFMTGKFPFMMFGLPAAALAIYHEARPENKKRRCRHHGVGRVDIVFDRDYRTDRIFILVCRPGAVCHSLRLCRLVVYDHALVERQNRDDLLRWGH